MLAKKIKKYIQKNNLFNQKDKLLLALSGGADSISLAHLLLKNGFTFAIAHCNFQLRGKDSDLDQVFVQEFAESNKLPFYTKNFGDHFQAKENKKPSTQLTARNLRYEWFNELCDEHNLDYILTAHHANDNVETLLFQLSRGTGIKGMRGILPKSGRLIRPLLFATRPEIEEYIQQNDLKFREDTSNATDNYNRNYIRHQIVPKFEKLNPSFTTSVQETIERMQEVEQLFNYAIQQIKSQVLKEGRGEVIIDLEKLKTHPAPQTVLYELVQEYGFTSDQIRQILTATSGQIVESQSHELLIDRHEAILQLKSSTPIQSPITINKTTTTIQVESTQITIQLLDINNFTCSKSSNIAQLDADKLTFPLSLRHWKEGDYFYPLGMKGKKQLVSDFFNNNKLSIFQKRKILILETSNNEICYILGMRIDDRFQITKSTKQVLIIQNPK
jgi:tRNA(Ile)-lysidine synthase